jgi:hypothetical protein
MKIKKTASDALVAKIEYMLSTDVLLTEADSRFLTDLLLRLRHGTTELPRSTHERIERIFELDVSRRVYRVKASQPSPLRMLSSVDPFSDIGTKVLKGRRL